MTVRMYVPYVLCMHTMSADITPGSKVDIIDTDRLYSKSNSYMKKSYIFFPSFFRCSQSLKQ